MEANILLPDLNDPKQYTCIPNVAILDEETPDDPEFDWLTLDLLHNLVANTNRRIDDGELVLINIGHNDKDLPETEQPPIVGYGRNLQMGTLKGRNVILADLYYKTECYEYAMTFPRRSCELYLDRDFIDVVSLLRRRPARNLGLVTLKSKTGWHRYLKSTGASMDFNDLDLETLASHLAKALKKCLSEDTADESVEEPKDEDKKENEYSAPAGDNTFVPGEVEEKKEEQRMRSEQDAIRLSQVESENGILKKRLGEVELQLRRSNRERDLKQLSAEGYQFDMVDELKFVEQLEDKAYAKHMERARGLYKRMPVGNVFIATEDPGVALSHGSSKEEVGAVVDYGTKHGIKNYQVALAKYKEAK